ncbi:putative bifunctional diguanylate cyclase/phosphodiesterase [Nitrosococcus watsonii]|nr:EAL domain-containing protein [Nitrosococcus watsonii]
MLLALGIALGWFFAFPLKASFDINKIMLEAVILAAASITYPFILRLERNILIRGWELLLCSLLLGLLEEFTQEPWFWDTFVEGALRILGLILIAFGFYRSQRLSRAQPQKNQTVDNPDHHPTPYDTLTGLPNHTLLRNRLEQAMGATRQLALLFLDLDRLKEINDSFGHEAGDRELTRVAKLLQDCLEPTDTALRIGGDEFAIIQTPALGVDKVTLLAQRLLDAIARPHQILGHEIHNSASIGITLFPSDGNKAEQLLKNADIAMYHAKHEGQNNYQLYTPAINARAHPRMALAKDLQSAFESGNLYLQFQPQLNLATGRTSSFEALLRWRHPQHGMLARQTFIRLAEETGLIIPIGAWAIETACQSCVSWRQLRPGPLRIAVNLSPRQFRQPDLAGSIATLLEKTKLAPSALEVEITEGLLLEDMDSAFNTLQSLSALGVHISVDDFGTGHASLSYLKNLPFDSIKIDRSFIQGIPTDPESRTITKAVIALGHSLNLKVVAEGVETPEQLLYLQKHHCDLIQGYFISKPLDMPEAQQWWEEKGEKASS